MPPRRRNNKKKKGKKPADSAEPGFPSVAAAAQEEAEGDESGSDSNEAPHGAAPADLQSKSDAKELKPSPARDQSPDAASRTSPGPEVAEAKRGSSPAGGPRSSEKPSRPTTPAAAEQPSAKSTARPVKSRDSAPSSLVNSHADRSAEKEQARGEASASPEVKRLQFDAKSEEKSSEKKASWESKAAAAAAEGSGAKAGPSADFASPSRVPGEEPPDEIVESFRSARKAIENSVDRAERRARRERSDSLDAVLRDHPHIVDPLTGEVSGSLLPSEDVLLHHHRTASARELVGLGTVPASLQKPQDKASPKHNTAVALTNAAKALEGKLSMPKRVERRPSLNILLDSGILQIPEGGSSGSGSGRRLAHLEEQQFLDALSPSASAARARAADGDGDGSVPPRALAEPAGGGGFSAPAFSSPLPPSKTHIYQYVPYKVLEKRVVIGLALRIVSELKTRAMVDKDQAGAVKEKIFRGDIDVVMAVEQFACNRDLEVFVALMYDIACDPAH